MAYSQAQINAMNKYGAAQLAASGKDTKGNSIVKPVVPSTKVQTPGSPLYVKPAVPSLPSAGSFGSNPATAKSYGYTPPTPYSPKSTPYSPPVGTSPLGNQKMGNNGGGSGAAPATSWVNKSNETPVEPAAPAWLGTGIQQTAGITAEPEFDTTQMMDDLKQAQIRAQVAALDKQRNNSLSNLDTEQAGLGSVYYEKRNQAAAASDVSAMNFAQRAASRGISGNAGAMPEIYRNSALQGQIGALDQAEASANASIESNRANVRNNYEADLVAAQAGIEAQALQNYISQMNTDREFGVTEAGLTGSYKGAQTLDGQAKQLSNQMAQLSVDAQAIQNSYLPQTLKDQATLLKQQVEVGKISPATALAQLEQIKRETANVGASTALGYANLNYSKSQDAINNANETYNNAISNINSLYVTSDAVTGGNKINKTGLRAHILSLNLPDAQTTQLIKLYGV